MKKQESKNVSYGDRKPPQFIKYRLSEEEMSQAKLSFGAMGSVADVVGAFIEEGYKVSCSHDSYGGGTQVFITPSEDDNPNTGFTLSARAPDLESAFGVLVFKHYTLFQEVWPKDVDSPRGAAWS